MTAHPEAAPAWTPEEEARAVRVLAEFMGWRDVALSRGCPDAWPNFNAGDGVMYVQRVSGGNSLPWNPFADANAEQQVAERALEVWKYDRRAASRYNGDLYNRLSERDGIRRFVPAARLRTGDRARAIYRLLTEAR